VTSVLIDTSVWISYFRPCGSGDLVLAIRDVILEGRGCTCWPVQAELLVGARELSSFERLRALLASLVQLPVDEELWERTARLGFDLRRKGLTIPLPDLLIAETAIAAQCELWHADQHYEAIREHRELLTRSFLGEIQER
jgi:predicted nucleic acid-binding protein